MWEGVGDTKQSDETCDRTKERERDMRVYAIDPRRTALLVIDAQKEYFKEGGPAYLPAARSVLGNIRTLIEAARKARALVVYAQHMNRADGSDAGRMGDFSDPSARASFVEGSPEVVLVDGFAAAGRGASS
jgi:ureidoacrylate peracid hydrolase